MRRLLMIVDVTDEAIQVTAENAATRVLDEDHAYEPGLIRATWLNPEDDVDVQSTDEPGPTEGDEPEDPALPDREIEAMATIVRSLTPLDPAGRAAVVNYLFDRYSATDARG